MNLGELRSQVRTNVGEPNPDYYTNSELNYWLNEGQEFIAVEANILETSSITQSISGVQEYRLPDFIAPVDFIKLIRVTYDNNKLLNINFRDKDAIESSIDLTTTQNTAIKYYYIFSDKLGLVGIPDESSKEIKIYYIERPDELVDDTDIPQVSLQWQRGLIEYATAKALQKDKKFQQAQIYSGQLERRIRQAKSHKSEPTKDRLYKFRHFTEYNRIGTDVI